MCFHIEEAQRFARKIAESIRTGPRQVQQELENMIDEHGIHTVLHSISDIVMDRKFGSTKNPLDDAGPKLVSAWDLHIRLEPVILWCLHIEEVQHYARKFAGQTNEGK